MPMDRVTPSQELLDHATMLLAKNFQAAVSVTEAEHLRGSTRSLVFRLHLASASAAPQTVILKAANPKDVPFAPDSPTIPAWSFFNEWASLQFLTALGADAAPAPRWLAGDRNAGILIMEDLGQGARLDHILLGSDAIAAMQMLTDYAATQGRMHAATRAHRADFLRIRQALGPLDDATRTLTGLDWLVPVVEAMQLPLMLPAVPGVSAEAQQLITALQNPDPWHTFTQGDPCPDNCMVVGDRLHLLDFEGGHIKHALLDGIYGTMRFPTCWCVDDMPTSVVDSMAQAYRHELQRGMPEATDETLYGQAITDAAVFWVLEWCRNFPMAQMLEQDQVWRMATVRQRFMRRVAVAADLTVAHHHLEVIGTLFRHIHAALLARWPAEAHTMALYPAFQ